MSRTDKNINFTDEAKWYAAQTPHYRYDNSYTLVRPKSFTKTIHKPTQTSSWRIPKEKEGPAPGLYDSIKAHDYISKKKDFVLDHKSTSKRTNFTDAQSKLVKYVPGMGHYKEIDNGYAIRSKAKSQCKMRQ